MVLRTWPHALDRDCLLFARGDRARRRWCSCRASDIYGYALAAALAGAHHGHLPVYFDERPQALYSLEELAANVGQRSSMPWAWTTAFSEYDAGDARLAEATALLVYEHMLQYGACSEALVARIHVWCDLQHKMDATRMDCAHARTASRS